MADDDFEYDDDESTANAAAEAGDVLDELLDDTGEEPSEEEHSLGISRAGIRDWLAGKRGWLLLIGLSIAIALFSNIMYFLRADAKPVSELAPEELQNLAIEMLGHEVKISQIYQLIPMRGGKRMTVGLDIVLILGQLPEERIAGAPRPNEMEMALFISAIQDMEPAIRSRVNIILQKVPVESYGTVEVYKTIKDDVGGYVNDTLEGLDFGKGLRKDIGKRRVTDVLLPMFVRQMM